MKQAYRCLQAVAVIVLLAGICFGQANRGRNSYTFHGKVEAIDQNAGTLRVDGEEVKGWMEAMTMDYKVDDPGVLKKVKPGNRIMATVYDGDLVLHKVMVMPSPGDGSKSKK